MLSSFVARSTLPDLGYFTTYDKIKSPSRVNSAFVVTAERRDAIAS